MFNKLFSLNSKRDQYCDKVPIIYIIIDLHLQYSDNNILTITLFLCPNFGLHKDDCFEM